MSEGFHKEIYDVVVVGSFNTDLSLYTDVIPLAGQTVMGSRFSTGFGGKGANQAITALFLGASVRLIAKVGNDTFGKGFLDYLGSVGIPGDGVTVTTEDSTGVAFITVEEDRGENRIIVVPGANMLLTDVDVDKANASRWLHSRVVLCQLEIPISTTLRALEVGKRNGALTILNPAPMICCATAADVGYRRFLDRILALSDYCCPNETEAVAIVSSHGLMSYGKEDIAQDIPVGVVACLRLMAEKGVKYPIVTLGAKGAVLQLDRSLITTRTVADIQVYHITEGVAIVKLAAPHIDDVVDSTGAGDCFVGALAYFVARHPDLGPIEHVRRAIWIASQSVRKAGTQASYPRRDALPLMLFEAGTMSWPN